MYLNLMLAIKWNASTWINYNFVIERYSKKVSCMYMQLDTVNTYCVCNLLFWGERHVSWDGAGIVLKIIHEGRYCNLMWNIRVKEWKLQSNCLFYYFFIFSYTPDSLRGLQSIECPEKTHHPNFDQFRRWHS